MVGGVGGNLLAAVTFPVCGVDGVGANSGNDGGGMVVGDGGATGEGVLVGVFVGAAAEEFLLSFELDLSDLDLEWDLFLEFPPPLPVVLAGAVAVGGLFNLDLVALAASAALLLVVLWLLVLIFSRFLRTSA